MARQFSDKFLERLDRIDRKRLKNYLQELISENIFMEKAINNMEYGIFILDKNAQIKLINPHAEFLLGVSFSKLRGRMFEQCPLDAQIIAALKGILKKNKQVKRDIPVSFPKKGLLRILIIPLEDDKSNLLGWMGDIQDITEARQRDLHRIQTEKLKALVTLAAGVAHELGNPLNSLAIHLQLVNRKLKKLTGKNKEKLIKPLSIAQTEIKRLDYIISNFLQATRPLRPRFLLSDIHNVIDEALVFLKAELGKNRIKINKRYYTKIPRIYLDYIQLRQAFVNVIKNAAEAMPNGGTLRITTSLKDTQIRISFKDTGIGIPEDNLDKIFEPYYTSKVKGSGLGLWKVHRAVRGHDGYIDVKSRLGQGANIIIYLPVESRSSRLLPQSTENRKPY